MGEQEASLLEDAYRAISITHLWGFMKREEPPSDQGYSYWLNENLMTITGHMKLASSHSGASYGWTMRQMQQIAKRGWDE